MYWQLREFNLSALFKAQLIAPADDGHTKFYIIQDSRNSPEQREWSSSGQERPLTISVLLHILPSHPNIDWKPHRTWLSFQTPFACARLTSNWRLGLHLQSRIHRCYITGFNNQVLQKEMKNNKECYGRACLEPAILEITFELKIRKTRTICGVIEAVFRLWLVRKSKTWKKENKTCYISTYSNMFNNMSVPLYQLLTWPLISAACS